MDDLVPVYCPACSRFGLERVSVDPGGTFITVLCACGLEHDVRG